MEYCPVQAEKPHGALTAQTPLPHTHTDTHTLTLTHTLTPKRPVSSFAAFWNFHHVQWHASGVWSAGGARCAVCNIGALPFDDDTTCPNAQQIKVDLRVFVYIAFSSGMDTLESQPCDGVAVYVVDIIGASTAGACTTTRQKFVTGPSL